MTLTIELTPEQEAELRAQAAAAGLDETEYARQRLTSDLPEIEFRENVPYIRGTRMKIRLIAEEFRNGSTLLDILETHPHLTFLQVQAALSYYQAHREEIDARIEELREWSEANRRPSSAPTSEQLRERLREQGFVKTESGWKKSA